MRTAFARVSIVLLTVYLLALAGQGQASSQAIQDPAPKHVRLRGHVATYATAAARLLGRLPSNTNIPLIFVLPLHHKEELQVLLTRLYDPADPLYGQYLSPEEFAVRFGPTQADYDAVADYARTMGLTVTGTHQNRTLLNVSGSTSGIESAFSLRLQHYEAANGRRFYAADNDPEVPDVIASRIVGILGLDNAAVWHSHNSLVPATQASPHQIGTGPGGGLTPSDIRKAYNIAGVTFNGAGQTLGLFELDGYTPTDVAAYLGYYGLPSVPLQNVIVDGFSGVPGSGAGEVTLDIELQVALAPGASRIIVYEGPNSITGVVDTYNRIATDNLAKQISSSWGLEENLSFSGAILAEDAIFQQMAAQGQSIYAASGDKGAYDNGSTLSVDDPASQPYMVGTGGTKLFVNADGTYNHETAWNTNGTINGGAGGGGISTIWSIPSWQQGVVSGQSLGSTTMRNVPDVSLNADPNSGYSIYYLGGWYLASGTSCAAPLWAAFTARINQQRADGGIPPLGFANASIYQAARGTAYGIDFHDIADASTNLYYPAVTGYDLATGWGSFNGANLLADLYTTEGPANTSFGQNAGSKTTGSDNAFFGFSAGYANTSGSYDSFFGYHAGLSNTSSNLNSFFGYSAGSSNTVGGDNSFFGAQAGSVNTSGSHNSFFGTWSGLQNTTGSFNAFFGQAAGATNTTGARNSLVGYMAGSANTSGGNNTFFGYSAGSSNTTENNNSFLGAYSDGAAGITNATAVGYQAKVTQSNSLVLGSINGVNGATADTNVGIGTTTPAERLSVNGNVKILTPGNGLIFPDGSKQATAAFGTITAVNPGTYLTGGGTAGGVTLDVDTSKIPTLAANTFAGTQTINSGNLILGSNAYLGIGTTAPVSHLNVTSASTASPRGVTNEQYNNGMDGVQFRGRKARGTPATPAAIQSGDVLGNYVFDGHDGSAFGTGVQIRPVAEENWSPTAHGAYLALWTTVPGSTANTEKMRITGSGNVGIGTTNPTESLQVVGNLKISGAYLQGAPEQPVPDYVFESGYNLMPIGELQEYVETEKHLPNIPNAKEVKQKGLNLGEFQMKLLEKIEELTLYTVQQARAIDRKDAEIAALSARLAALEQVMGQLIRQGKN